MRFAVPAPDLEASFDTFDGEDTVRLENAYGRVAGNDFGVASGRANVTPTLPGAWRFGARTVQEAAAWLSRSSVASCPGSGLQK